MNYFITGGNGFIGRELIKALKQNEPNSFFYTPNSKELNLLNPIVLDKIKFDYIIHLAAYTQAGDFCNKYPFDQFEVNNFINLNVLQYWKKSTPEAKFIAMGTSVSFDGHLEMSEDNYLYGIPIDMYKSYAYSKRNLLIGLQSANKQFGMKFNYYIPSTIVGESYPFDGRNLHFIYDIARKFVEFKNGKSKKIELIGDPNTRREVLNVKDFCSMVISTMTNENQIYNIGSRYNFTMEELSNNFIKILDIDPAVVSFSKNKGFGVKSKFLNSNKIYSETKHNEISFEETLNEIIIWAKKNY
jgi:GDP-L-fucose synthase